MEFSSAQRSAIEERGSNLLVSAAAGSGKTAVLAARIVGLVRDGMDMRDLLVVTFTKAAAAEMRARILKEMREAAQKEENRRLSEQALLVERADISTLHGFCTQILRNHFEAAQVDPTFRVADESQAAQIRESALEEALQACFEKPTPGFSFLSECLSQKEIRSCLMEMKNFLDAQPDPEEWLRQAFAMYEGTPETLMEGPWMQVLLRRAALGVKAAEKSFAEIAAEEFPSPYGELAKEDWEIAQGAAKAISGGFRQVKDMGKISFRVRPRRPKNMDAEVAEEYAALRDRAKKQMQDALEEILSLPEPELLWEDLSRSKLMLQGLVEALKIFEEAYAIGKARHNVLDFADLEKRALLALRNPLVAQAVSGKYRQICVDEYQDSSRLQEAILTCINRNHNLFMVGDVKQSIYRFRLADPGLFLEKLKTYRKEKGAAERRIDLSANYRTHPAVLSGINRVFEYAFAGGGMEIDYDEDAHLQCGRQHDWEGAPVEIHLVEPEHADADEENGANPELLTPEERSKLRQETEWIAEKIHELRHAPEKNYQFRDFAILLRAVKNGRAQQVVSVLRSRGIPAWAEDGGGLGQVQEVQQALALLRVIENRRQDVPLLAALKGPALQLEDTALADIRIAAPTGTFADAALSYAQREDDLGCALKGFFQRVERWRKLSLSLDADRLLRLILEETGFYAACGALPDGERRQASLRLLCEQAADLCRSQNVALPAFLRQMDQLVQRDGMAPRTLGEGDDVVSVMTIHKSKGLQFPVVFLAGMGSRFNTRQNGMLRTHGEMGIGIAAVDPQMRALRKTLACRAIEGQARMESIAEEARVLYVGMTRAENRLIVMGTPSCASEEKWHFSAPPETAGCFLDWLMPAALSSSDFRIYRHPFHITGEEAAEPDMSGMLEILRSTPSPSSGKIFDRLSFHPVLHDKRVLKQSVTGILNLEAKSGEEETVSLISAQAPRRPEFMEKQGMTPAERGEAVHVLLRNLPLSGECDSMKLAGKLEARGILSRSQAQSLNHNALGRFVKSGVYARMCASEKVWREVPFNLRLPGETLSLLQGVIDCCFVEDGRWVLLDYKSSWSSRSALLDRYRPQLDMYAEALEKLTDMPVKEKIIYSINTGELIPVEEEQCHES